MCLVPTREAERRTAQTTVLCFCHRMSLPPTSSDLIAHSSHTDAALSVTLRTSTEQGALSGAAIGVCITPETNAVWTQRP